jgi:hypothetical protein
VARLSGALSPREGAIGPAPRFIEVLDDINGALRQATEVVLNLLGDLPTEDIAVLTCAPSTRQIERALRTADVLIAKRRSDTGLILLPAHEFRGCEAPAVLLIAGPAEDCAPAVATTNHYVATSRAVADLTILGRAEDWRDYRYMMERT